MTAKKMEDDHVTGDIRWLVFGSEFELVRDLAP